LEREILASLKRSLFLYSLFYKLLVFIVTLKSTAYPGDYLEVTVIDKTEQSLVLLTKVVGLARDLDDTD
jgi:hypothetical protein